MLKMLTAENAKTGAVLAEKFGVDLYATEILVEYEVLRETLEGFTWVPKPAKVFRTCRFEDTTALSAAQQWENRNFVIITNVTRA